MSVLLSLSIFDACAARAALEQLCYVARKKGHDRANRFSIILRQTRPLMGSPTFQQVLLKLLGSDEEVAIAKEIEKAVKQTPGVWPKAPNLLQVPVPLVKRGLFCALIVAAGVISLDHAGGLKTSINSVEERRCNCLLGLIKYFPLCYLCVFTFGLVPFRFISRLLHLLFLLFWAFAYSTFPSAILVLTSRVISITPYNSFTTDSWSSSVSGFFPFRLYIFFSAFSLVFLVSPFL